MKKIIIIAALVFVNIYNLAAQTSNNSIVVFTEGGERFYLILNGLKQNSTAETNVKAAGLNTANYKAKVIFEDKAIADCDKTIPMMWGGEAVSNTEFVFSVSKDRKGNYKWKFVSQGPVAASTYATTVSTNTVSSGNGVTTTTSGGNGGVTITGSTGGVGTTVTTSTTTSTGTGNTGANINMGVNGTGLSLNINVNDGMNGGGMTSTTTTTTTYSTSTTTNGVTTSATGGNTQVTTGSTDGNVGMNVNVTGMGANTATSTYTTSTASAGTGSAISNCGYPISASEFSDAKKSIEAKSFEDTKMTIAKQVADNNCMNVEQIKGIMALFSFEQTKLDFAKYCYANCYDKKNYYKMSDAFTYEASTTELNEYIKGK